MKFLHENRLKLLHKQIRSVFTPEYYNRYIDVRLDNHVDRFEWRRKDFARLMSLLEFERAYTGVGFNKLLTFNGENDPEVKLINCDLWFDAAYKEGHDLHCLELNYNNYDFVMMNQTIEHLYNPLLALENIYDHMAEDGVLYMNFPVNNIPHDQPLNFYTGFTLMGVAALLLQAGFEITAAGEWGNREYLRVMMENRTWPTYDDLTQHSLNETCCPVIGWIWGQK